MADEKICPKCAMTFASSVVFCTEDGTALVARDGDPLVGQVIADRYRIISRIGEGGMGQVYLAEHVHMRRRCAVKFLNPDLVGNEFALKRFMREAENASRIDHPNVVTMYDFGEAAGGAVYLAMEFVDGESLRKRIERQGVLPTEMIASVIRQTASALHAAHQLQIVHRDLKPDNIMLIDRDDEVRVKVVDFGIAKAKDPRQKVTVTGAIVGTPDYMSPEQVTGDEMDGTSDQYALALVAVKMLTGKLPFAATTGVESLTSRLFTEPLPLRTLRADVAWPKQLQDVINRALSPKPADRFGAVTEFAKAFDRALSTLQGAVASTVPEIQLAEVVPPTRVHDGVATTVVEPAPRRARKSPRTSPWMMAAAAVIVVGSGTLYAVNAMRSGDPAGVAPYNLPVPDSTSPTADSIRQQAAGVATPEDASPVSKTAAPVTASAAPRAEAHQPPAAAAQPKSTPVAGSVVKVVDTQATSASREPAAPAGSPLPASTAPAASAPAEAPKPAALTSTEVSAEIGRARPMMTAESPRADVEGAIAALDRMLPKVGLRSDSIRVLYARAQAQAVIENLPAACGSLASALKLAAGTRIEETIARTARDLSCP